jgi:hypothetical protein
MLSLADRDHFVLILSRLITRAQGTLKMSRTSLVSRRVTGMIVTSITASATAMTSTQTSTMTSTLIAAMTDLTLNI